jgi:hypothetical protein
MGNSVDTDGAYGEAAKRRKKDSAQCIAYGLAIARFKRSELKLAERIVGFKHDDLVGFLKC